MAKISAGSSTSSATLSHCDPIGLRTASSTTASAHAVDFDHVRPSGLGPGATSGEDVDLRIDVLVAGIDTGDCTKRGGFEGCECVGDC